MGAGLLLILLFICLIKYCCCRKSKEEKQLEQAYQVSQRNEQEMALMQREQYLGPGKTTNIYSPSPTVVYGNRAVSTNRALSLQRSRTNSTHSTRRPNNLMVYNPEYAGVQIPNHNAEFAGSTYRVSNTYRVPLRDSRRNSYHSQRSLRRTMHASEDSLIPESQYSNDVFQNNNSLQSQKSIEQIVAEKLDDEVERRLKIELAKIMADPAYKATNGKSLRFNLDDNTDIQYVEEKLSCLTSTSIK